MKKQFKNLNTSHGAPMGRHDNGTPTPEIPIQVFKVALDSGGYDDGGAYWGLPENTHDNLYCATDGGDFQKFIRSESRFVALCVLAELYDEITIDPAHWCKPKPVITPQTIVALIAILALYTLVDRISILC